MRLKEVIKKWRLYKKTNWKITDYLMEPHSINDNQMNPIDVYDTSYTCIRDLAGYALYIPTDYVEDFYKISDYYNPDYKVFNLTEIKRGRYKRNYTSDVYDKITPATVKLKLIDYITINERKIFIVYTTDLDYDDDLYNDLINFHKIEGRN